MYIIQLRITGPIELGEGFVKGGTLQFRSKSIQSYLQRDQKGVV